MKNSNKALIMAISFLALFCHLKAARAEEALESTLPFITQFLPETDRPQIARISRRLRIAETNLPTIINVTTDAIFTNTTRLANLRDFLRSHSDVRINFPCYIRITDAQLGVILQHQTGVRCLTLNNCRRLTNFNPINNCPLIGLYVSQANFNSDQLRQILQHQPNLSIFSSKLCSRLQTFTSPDNCPVLQEVYFQNCRSLQEIYIMNHPLQTLTAIKCNIQRVNLTNCSHLRTLHFDENRRLSTINLNGCPVLRMLNLSSTNIDDQSITQIVQSIRQSLTVLELRNCQRLNQVEIRDCPNLQKLNLSRCIYLARINLSGCNNLQELDLSQTNITDEFLRSILEQVKSLKFIHLVGCRQITSAIEAVIRERGIEIKRGF